MAPRAAAAIVLCLAAMALGACRDEEQGRTLVFDKGHYARHQDGRPSQQALADLQKRIAAQKF